ncbi:MAG: zinc-dependent alcohol dehydrogenase [Myxococcota bacterium]
MTSPPSMRAARVRGPQQFGVDDVPVPEPGPGEVRVRIEACGICGSDLHFYHGALHAVGHTPGHEMAGVVDRLGPDVQGFTPGDRVAVEPIRSCGDCALCRSGRDNVCRATRVLGIHEPGGFAEHIVVPSRRLFDLPHDLDPAIGALTEPVAVSIHGLRRGRFEKGQRVLVLGSGAVGLVTVLAARQLGAGEVWASARYPMQGERARSLGADRVLTEPEADPASLARLGLEHDIDLVVETVGGRADTLRAACAAIRPGGTVSVLGLFFDTVEVDPFSLLLKEGTLAWSNCYDRQGAGPVDFERAAQLVGDERERLSELLTHRVALEDVDEAYRLAADKRSGAVKVSVLTGAAGAH